MPSELNLPRLRKDGRVRSPAKGGAWTRLDQLNELAAALEIEAGKMLLRDIKSVPHTWGHVIVFETALFNEHHPAHEDAKGQWRALLTMLALRNRPGYSVRTKSVSLGAAHGAETAVQQFAAGRRKGATAFENRCRGQLGTLSSCSTRRWINSGRAKQRFW